MKHAKQNRQGVAIVITLLVIVVLTIAATAFMQSMALERRTSLAYLNILKANEAAEAGLERVKQILSSTTANDDFIIVKQTSPSASTAPAEPSYYFVGKGRDSGTGSGKTAAATEYYPLFSYEASPQTVAPQTPPSATGPGASNNMPVIPTMADPALRKPALPAVFPQVDTSWETVNTGNPAFPRIRYSFWAEDMSGYLDTNLVGNLNGPGMIHTRSDGSESYELALFTIFDPSANVDPGITAATEIVKNRSLMVSPATPKQAASLVSPLPDPDLVTKNLTSGTSWEFELETIPAGFGYKDAGSPKFNLNDLVATSGAGANVAAIASVINDNLPLFNTTARKGSFGYHPNQDYVKNIAANIVDYVDADNNATVATDYRGIDSYPFVTEHFLRLRWRGANPNQFYVSGETWKARVDVDLWIQVWNPSDKDINSGVLTWDDSGNEYSLYVAGSSETPLFPRPAGSPAQTVDFSVNPLKKNEYRVINFPVVTYVCDTGISGTATKPTVASGGPRLSWMGVGPSVSHNSSNYSVLWNGTQTDRPGSETSGGGNRIERRNGTLNSESTTPGENTGSGSTWRGAHPGLRYFTRNPADTSSGFGENNYNLGDPRSSYNMASYMSSVDYDGNSSWYGRAYQYSLINPSSASSTPWLAAESHPESWPDGGHSGIRAPTIYELQPGSSSANERYRNNRTPTDIPAASHAPYSDAAPSHISNSGTYQSALELGSIYDPAQWRPDWKPTGGNTFKPANRSEMLQAWNSLDTQPMIADPPSGTPPVSSVYGLASTLRIGRGEFLTLDAEGIRASQFLDLFSANPESRQSTRGRININTATRDALRALYAGITVNRDPDLEPSALRGALYPPSTAPPGGGSVTAADIFADTTIANRPFLSLAKLSSVRTSTDDPTSDPKVKLPLFGNAKLWAASSQPSAWNDRAHEEIFAKAFNLAAVRSRNFRVFVVGQVLNAQGKVAAQSQKVYQLYASAPRTPDGEVDPNAKMSMKVVYESSQ